jgi:hypothetical protein
MSDDRGIGGEIVRRGGHEKLSQTSGFGENFMLKSIDPTDYIG